MWPVARHSRVVDCPEGSDHRAETAQPEGGAGLSENHLKVTQYKPAITVNQQNNLGYTSLPGQTDDQSIVVPVIAETLHVSKETVESGRVKLTKVVHEETETVSVPLFHDEVQVEHVPINQFVETAPPAVRHEGETMIVSVMKEIVITETRLMLVEELHVTKRQIQTDDVQQVTLRREEVTVERVATNPANPLSV